MGSATQERKGDYFVETTTAQGIQEAPCIEKDF